jgi:hypothetical protein
MEQMTRTIYAASLQTSLFVNLPPPIPAHSTLNERFAILAGTLPTAGNPPKCAYYSLGNGGHTFTVGANGIPMPEPVQHRATDAAAYKPIPFVMRLPTNDLTTAEQANYCLRRIETWQGQNYVCYYGKRIDFTGVTVNQYYKTVDPTTGNVTTTAFVPDSSNLNPTPPDLSSTGVNVTTGDYVSADCQLDLSLSASDCTELLNVGQIMFGDPNAAIVSEVLLCSGVDYPTNVQSGVGNGTFVFTDAIAMQVMTFVDAFAPINFLNNGVDIILDVGATEPLLNLSGNTSTVTSSTGSTSGS